MKKLMKIILIILSVIAVLIIAIFLLLLWSSKQSEMETSGRKYPLVIMVNGSGTPASRYEAVFDHLASLGFIVAGNEDSSSGTGQSAASTLDFILGLDVDVNSLFYGKIDTQNIGIAGHSQGRPPYLPRL